MKKVVLFAALLLGLALTSCYDEDSDILNVPTTTSPNGGDEDEDDPVPPGGGGRANIEDVN